MENPVGVGFLCPEENTRVRYRTVRPHPGLRLKVLRRQYQPGVGTIPSMIQEQYGSSKLKA